jgi:hypothetical protein
MLISPRCAEIAVGTLQGGRESISHLEAAPPWETTSHASMTAGLFQSELPRKCSSTVPAEQWVL